MSYFENDHGMSLTSLTNLVRVCRVFLLEQVCYTSRRACPIVEYRKLVVQIGDTKMHGSVNVGLS